MENNFLEKLLNYYNLSVSDYEKLTSEINKEHFFDDKNFDVQDKAIKIIKECISSNGKILIYGDYDADGILGTSILAKMLNYLHYDADFYIPNRSKDGYGLNLKQAEIAKNNNYSLVIMVDNGINSNEAISYLKNNNIKTIVIDHHNCSEEIAQADAIIHPIYSNFANINSSGAFTAFAFSTKLLGYFDDYLSTLAAISIISDLMPLIDYNRDFLRLVFSDYKNKSYPQIDILKEDEPFNENSIGLKIAPKINSIGRIVDDESINQIVYYFLTDDSEKIEQIATWINETNEKRKEMVKESFDFDFESLSKENAIIIKVEINEGLIGLLANQLLNKYKVPVFIFSTLTNNNQLKGSARTPNWFDLTYFFKKYHDLFINCGGHKTAGGCLISTSNFDALKESLNQYTCELPKVIEEKPTITITLNDINKTNYEILNTFSPFGEQWEKPLFRINGINTASLMYSKNQQHILTQIGMNSRIIGFGFSKTEVSLYKKIDIIGRLSENIYMGYKKIVFNIKSIIKSK